MQQHLQIPPARLSDIRHALKRVTPRMLSARLGELHELGAVKKRLSEQPRPSFLYQLHRHVDKPINQLAANIPLRMEPWGMSES